MSVSASRTVSISPDSAAAAQVVELEGRRRVHCAQRYPDRTFSGKRPRLSVQLTRSSRAQYVRAGACHTVLEEGRMATKVPSGSASDADTADLASFGYAQSLHRRLHFFSSFAAAFSYISPATGIFTLFILGFATLGGAFIWTFPVVALGQFIVALVFAEVSSHFPLAGSVFQWTKYLSRSKPYAWFSGWIYLWAGALTVAAVVATLPLTLIPMLNDIGIDMSADSLTNQKWVAAGTLVVITLLNIFGVRVVALINNTGVLFELLGLFVFAIILALFNNNQGVDVVFDTGGAGLQRGQLPRRDVHGPVRDLRLRHRVDAGGGDQRPAPGGAARGAQARSPPRS